MPNNFPPQGNRVSLLVLESTSARHHPEASDSVLPEVMVEVFVTKNTPDLPAHRTKDGMIAHLPSGSSLTNLSTRAISSLTAAFQLPVE